MNKELPFSVILELKADTWQYAVSELVNTACYENKEEAFEAVMKREEEATTAIGDGVAVPHARLEGLESMEVVVGRSHRGIEMGGRTVHIFLLILIPQSTASSHVDFLSNAVRILSSSTNRERIMEAEGKDEILEVFAI